VNKVALFKQIDEMFWLPPNWDGFGTKAIAKTVHKVAYDLVDWADDSYKMRVYVGVEPEQSLWGELWFRDRKWEFTILKSGTIEYCEFCGDKILYHGAFLPDRKQFSALTSENDGYL
jgi:hypothetical protein